VTSLRVEKPDLTVAVVPAISAAGLYIAQQDGYFTAAGLHVKIVPIASGVNAIPNLASGSVDVDEGQWAADLAAQAKGIVKLHALASASAGGPGVQEIVIPAKSPITSVQQLAGKTIAVNALNGLAVLVTNIMLASHGVPVSSVHYVVMGFPDMGTALAAHRVDAAFIAEPSLSAAETGQGVQPLFDVDQGPTQIIPISGYVTTAAWARKYPRTAAAFTAALTSPPGGRAGAGVAAGSLVHDTRPPRGRRGGGSGRLVRSQRPGRRGCPVRVRWCRRPQSGQVSASRTWQLVQAKVHGIRQASIHRPSLTARQRGQYRDPVSCRHQRGVRGMPGAAVTSASPVPW
jgi:hypothetical protein